jgi:hypothetical protein
MTTRKPKPVGTAKPAGLAPNKQKPINPDDLLSKINKQNDTLKKLASRLSQPLEEKPGGKKPVKNKKGISK